MKGEFVMLSKFISSLKQEFGGYNAAALTKDLMAGLTVAAVALPLALAFGVSSGADAASGLITAIIAGLIMSLLSGGYYQISGPTGAMAAILMSLVAAYGMDGVFIATLIAGIILLLAGILHLGKLTSFIPAPVITGFTSGIAVIIALGQVDNFFGTHSEGTSAIGKLFNSLFGWNYMVAVIVGAIVIISYTSVGGFSAVATMDLIQSVIMTVALSIIVVFGIVQAGGMDAVLAHASSIPGFLSFGQTYNAASGQAEPYGLIRIVSMLAWGLGYFGMPHILVRFMAIRHEDELKLSRRIASIWVVISMAVAVFIGIVGHAVSNVGRIPALEGSATETVIVRLADLLSSYGILPAVVAGCILAGILAATMSTADSQLLAASSAFSENVLQDLFGVKLTPKQNMLAARLTVVVIAFIAIFLAADPNSNVFKIVSFAWAGFGATFGPTMLCALFWRRSNRQGIMAGLIVGGVMIFVWKFLVAPIGGIFNIYELLPAFLCALCAIVVVSLATPAPEKEITDMFDSYNT